MYGILCAAKGFATRAHTPYKNGMIRFRHATALGLLAVVCCASAPAQAPEGLSERRTPGGRVPGPFAVEPASYQAENDPSQPVPQRVPQQDVGKQILGFFGSIFHSVRVGTRPEKIGSQITIDPAVVNLEERRDFTVVFTVTNKTRQMLRLDFPTTQRIEILTRDPAGNVISRWSEDRAFEPKQGILTLNPDEKAEYTARIPTRDMKPGERYEVEAVLVGHPEYTATGYVVAR